MNNSPSPAMPAQKKPGPSVPLWKSLPDAWRMLQPNVPLLILGFLLMAIGKVAGLVMPLLTKPFVDRVLYGHQTDLLPKIVAGVLIATFVQALTSYTLSQIISKSAQRMIAELRRRVQTHIGRLPISFFDANKTGQLVSRVMNDVEGVRNLIGTGLIDFFGSILTAVLAFAFLVHVSVTLTAIAMSVLIVFGVGMRKAFAVIMRNIIVHRPRGRHGLVLLSGLEWFLEKFVTITGMICAPDPSNISLPMHRALETGDCAAPFPSVMKHPPAKPASSQQIFLKKRVQRFGHLLASSGIERKHHRVRFPFSPLMDQPGVCRLQ